MRNSEIAKLEAQATLYQTLSAIATSERDAVDRSHDLPCYAGYQEYKAVAAAIRLEHAQQVQDAENAYELMRQTAEDIAERERSAA